MYHDRRSVHNDRQVQSRRWGLAGMCLLLGCSWEGVRQKTFWVRQTVTLRAQCGSRAHSGFRQTQTLGRQHAVHVCPGKCLLSHLSHLLLETALCLLLKLQCRAQEQRLRLVQSRQCQEVYMLCECPRATAIAAGPARCSCCRVPA